MIHYIGEFDEVEKEVVECLVQEEDSIVLKTSKYLATNSLNQNIEYMDSRIKSPKAHVYAFDNERVHQIITPAVLCCPSIGEIPVETGLTAKDMVVYIHQGCSETCICTSAYKKKYSVPLECIIHQIEQLSQQEYVALYSINVGDYNSEGDNIISLCQYILYRFPSIKKLILGNISPYSPILEDLMKFIQSEPRMMPYIYICLNTGSEKVSLEQGHSSGDKDIGKLAEKYNVGLIPYIIAGYPSETEEDFNETLEWIARNKVFASIVLPYSPNGVGGIEELSTEEWTEMKRKMLTIIDKINSNYTNRKEDLNTEVLRNLLEVSVGGEDHEIYERYMRNDCI